MEPAAETMANGGHMDGVIIAIFITGLLGFIILVFPSIMRSKNIVLRLLVGGLMGFIVRQFPEKRQNLVARIFGGLLICTAILLGIILVALQGFVSKEEFHNGLLFELNNMEFPYTISVAEDNQAKVAYVQKPGDVFTFNYEHLQEEPPAEVAKQMIRQADQHFGVGGAAAPPGMMTSVMDGTPPTASGMPGALPGALPSEQAMPSSPQGMPGAFPPPAQTQIVEDLPTADRFLQEAATKWVNGDYGGSIKLAEKALAIKTKILGDDHVKVIEIKTQLTTAKQQYFQMQMK